MKTMIKIMSLLSVLFSAGFSSLWAADPTSPVATIHKPVGSVEYQAEGQGWKKAATATPLFSGNRVKTGENSFAIIKFVENSVLRVQEKSQITVRGELSAQKEFSKNVHVQRGQLGFNVQKRENEKFEFSTPTSVASIRGTSGLLISGADSADMLILGSGIVLFTNLISNQSVTVGAGQVGISLANGTLTVQRATPQQLQQMNNATQTGGGGGGGGQGGGGAGATGGTTTTGGMSFAFNLTASPFPVKEGESFDVALEITQSTISLDTLRNLISDIQVAYKGPNALLFTKVPASLTGNTVRVKIQDTSVTAPAVKVYLVLKTRTGQEITYPQNNPEANAFSIPVEAKVNQVRIEFLDPNGKRKTMYIEY